jgi:hypothetical protein
VTDEARHRLPDFDRLVDADGRLAPRAAARYFLSRPAEVARLVRLALAARRAGRSLGVGVQAVLRSP